MTPYMTANATMLLESLLQHTRTYVEFGSGGSTVLAARHVGSLILSVDSDPEWHRKVIDACAAQSLRTPTLITVDLGPTGEWGTPTDPNTRDRWPAYHTTVWDQPGAHAVDLCFIDGRFRVACFLQTLLHARAAPVIAIHDFASRPHYHVVRRFADEIASVDDLSVFRASPTPDRTRIERTLLAYEFTPD